MPSNKDSRRNKDAGYLYEIPLLVLIVTLLAALLWPWITTPWRLVVAGTVGFTVFLFLWYNRSR
jgi:hypothetical protein